MQTKLTLRMDDRAVAKAKKIAKLRHQSVSKLVENHFKNLPEEHAAGDNTKKLPEWIEQLGVKKWKSVSTKSDSRLEYLSKKHVKR